MRIRAGFSLWEVTIVLALITLLALVPLAYQKTCDTVTVRLEVQKLAMMLRCLRMQASATGLQATVVFDCSNNSYTVYGVHADKRTHTLPKGVVFGVISGCCGPPSAPTQIITNPCTFAADRIIVFPDGTVSSGAVYCKHATNSVGYAVTCGVAQISYVRCYRCLDVRHWKLLS